MTEPGSSSSKTSSSSSSIGSTTSESSTSTGPSDPRLAVLRRIAIRANLTHLTSDQDRAPTLYFAEGNLTFRIRQEHGKGPKLKAYIGDTIRFRIFYKTLTERRVLDDRLDDLPALVADEPTKYSFKPQDGWYQLEYSTMDNTAKGKVQKGRHFSGGIVVVNSESPLMKAITQPTIDGLLAKMTPEYG
ncbi:hypothetical protein ACFXHA_04315 [Nocardia sp. NPDC059240]|uniref:hypothetical protein n=1 Tax=Nocardia sp. NPDC059240 TaxID=3346786 RepID=UPI003674F139